MSKYGSLCVTAKLSLKYDKRVMGHQPPRQPQAFAAENTPTTDTTATTRRDRSGPIALKK